MQKIESTAEDLHPQESENDNEEEEQDQETCD